MKRIALVMQDLLQPNGDMTYSGGDRYTRDLARLIKDAGMEPTIFQKSPNGEFFDAKWEGFRVVGLPSKNAQGLNMDVAQNTQEYDASIYFHMLLAYPRVHQRAISISHGIWFDHVNMVPVPEDKWGDWRSHLQAVVSGVDRIVSVDTNTINFFGALFAGRYAHKFTHIPNAVDVNMYSPKPRKADGKVRVLYPRRADILRGLTEMMRLTEELSEKHRNAEFHLVGRSNPDQEKSAKQWAAQGKNRHYYWKKFDEMPAVYQSSDIAVIPTIGCEGTSYSLLEAMASGLPVVATTVGGLSELVIDGYNGIKVAPVYSEIRDAVDYLIAHPEERERMGKNARTVAEQFDKKKWDQRWSDVLHDLVR